MAERGEVQTYRFGSIGHTAARQKVSPERRHEIAVMGAAAKNRRQEIDIMMQLNVQIVPFDITLGRPAWAKIVQLSAREGRGEVQACNLCGGTGRFGRHEESCRKCDGTGKARFVLALRAEPGSEEQRKELSDLLDRLTDQGFHGIIQRTVRLAETGGGLTNTGHGTIVCGLKGEPLVGFGGQSRCGAAHATFFVHAALVVRYAQHRGQGSGCVEFIGIDRTVRHHLGIERVELWRFTDDAFDAYVSRGGDDEAIEVTCPERAEAFEFPQAAIEAARQKARCYHCRSAFYVDTGGARGPSGALRGAGAAFGGMPSPLKGPGIGYDPEKP